MQYYLKARFRFDKDEFANLIVMAGIAGSLSQVRCSTSFHWEWFIVLVLRFYDWLCNQVQLHNAVGFDAFIGACCWRREIACCGPFL